LNTTGDLDPIETLAEYHVRMAELELLMRDDPEIDSPEGRRLLALLDVIEDFERKTWPDMITPDDLDD
jgi:hypothetical protein